MLQHLHPQQFPAIEESLSQLIGPASFEWLYHFETATNRIVAYSSQNLEDCMIIFDEVNVLLVTSSQTVLQDCLKKLNVQKSYAFRCPDWMASTILERFPPRNTEHGGVVLLTCTVDAKDFTEYSGSRHLIRILTDDDADEVIVHSGNHWSLEFIRERIGKGSFYGVHEKNELVSWLGTLWESKKACEIGFAFTTDEYRGKGMMKNLTSILTEEILSKGKIPLLHTVQDNSAAIRTSQSLGYSLKAREWAYFYNP
jgi:predicted GNAT family acetyltransferase